MPMERWMASAAGGTSQRLNPGPATIRSLLRSPAMRFSWIRFRPHPRLAPPQLTEPLNPEPDRNAPSHRARLPHLPLDAAGASGPGIRADAAVAGGGPGRERGDAYPGGHGPARCRLRPHQRLPRWRSADRRPAQLDGHLALAVERQ